MIDAFRVGVTIAMSSNGDVLLGGLMRHMLGLHTAADELSNKLGRVKVAAIAAVGVFAGVEALRGIWGMVHASEELNHQLEMLKTKFGDDVDVGFAKSTAFQTSLAVPTTTPSQNVKALGELASQVGGMTEAAKILPEVQKLSFLVSSLTDGKSSPEQAAIQSIKFADLTGQLFSKDAATGREVVDPAKFTSMMTVVEKMIAASGGLTGTNDLLQFAKQGGLPLRLLTPASLPAMGEAIIAMGGARAGTAMTSLFQQFAGGQMKVSNAEEMQRYHLLSAKDWRSDHGHVVVNHEAAERLGALAADPYALAMQLKAQMESAGLNKEQMMIEVAKIFGRATTQRLMSELIQGSPQIDRYIQNYQKAPGIDGAYSELGKNDLATNLTSLQSAWTGLMQALGEQGVPVAIGLMRAATYAIHEMTTLVEAHPEFAKDLLGIAAGLAALVVLGGGITLVGTALTPFAGAIRAVGLAANPFAPGGQGALGLGGVIGLLTRLGLVAGAVHEALSFLDPKDSIGGWIDKHIPGAAAIDNLASHIGMGRTYAEQAAAAGVSSDPTPRSYAHNIRGLATAGGTPDNPIHIAGTVSVGNLRQMSQGAADLQSRYLRRPQSGPTGTDPRADMGVMGYGP